VHLVNLTVSSALLQSIAFTLSVIFFNLLTNSSTLSAAEHRAIGVDFLAVAPLMLAFLGLSNCKVK
jgi:hypothetical protein